MGNQTNLTKQTVQSSDPASLLKQIIEGKIGDVTKPENALTEGKKLSHDFLKWFVEELRRKGLDDKQILDVVIGLDEGVENGKVTEKTFSELATNEELKNSMNEEIKKHFSEDPPNE
ncbi:hypothetical protein JW796_00625 [Candidatus Dojkabacteria bacterium]|nr:hypothetical protein [Candidatus Dojkabacteria bacterium]